MIKFNKLALIKTKSNHLSYGNEFQGWIVDEDEEGYTIRVKDKTLGLVLQPSEIISIEYLDN